MRDLLQVGADKISVNTAAVKKPKLITEIAEQFGSQCCVVEIQTKCSGNGKWMALIENGREHSGKDAVEWACEAEQIGAGELLLTSVDRDGTKSGMDKILINEISGRVNIPIIASGGVGGPMMLSMLSRTMSSMLLRLEVFFITTYIQFRRLKKLYLRIWTVEYEKNRHNRLWQWKHF